MVEKSKLPNFAIIGLGKIGGNLARQALDKKLAVAGYTLGAPPADLIEQGLMPLAALDELRAALQRPRRVFLYIPAGPAVDETLDKLLSILEQDDIVVDGGNSYWGDSIRRNARAAEHGIRFADMGTSGGLEGARHGACFMLGGERSVFEAVEPVLKALSVDGGYVHAGPTGAGHYTKLVHNGIEFGMLQAIAEGMSLLTAHRDRLPIENILRCWTHGSVIRSWLIELMAAGYSATDGLKNTPPWIEDTGEVNWLVQDALEMDVPIPVISQSVMQLLASRDGQRVWARAIAAMRHGFGGHPFGRDDAIRRGRATSRVGMLWRTPPS
jgi:6-phosphogluconate dehydrogenase